MSSTFIEKCKSLFGEAYDPKSSFLDMFASQELSPYNDRITAGNEPDFETQPWKYLRRPDMSDEAFRAKISEYEESAPSTCPSTLFTESVTHRPLTATAQTVNPSSILFFKTSTPTKTYLTDTSSITQRYTVAQLKAIFTECLSNLNNLPPSELMGPINYDVCAEMIEAYHDSNSIQNTILGPRAMVEYLVALPGVTYSKTDDDYVFQRSGSSIHYKYPKFVQPGSFFQGMTFKNKRLIYNEGKTAWYPGLDFFCTYVSIKVHEGQWLLNTHRTDYARDKHAPITKFVDEVKAFIEKLPVWTGISELLHNHLYLALSNSTIDLDPFLDYIQKPTKIVDNLQTNVITQMSSFQGTNADKARAVINFVTTLGSVDPPDIAEDLAKARNKRNVALYEKCQKQMWARDYRMPVSTETFRKHLNIMNSLDVTLDNGVRDVPIDMIGIDRGHGVPALASFTTDLNLYDITPKKIANLNVTVRNVFDPITNPDRLIFDDTYLASLGELSKTPQYSYLSSTPHLAKLFHFATSKVTTFVSKQNVFELLNNFKLWSEWLKDYNVYVSKPGKYHNPEVYLFASLKPFVAPKSLSPDAQKFVIYKLNIAKNALSTIAIGIRLALHFQNLMVDKGVISVNPTLMPTFYDLMANPTLRVHVNLYSSLAIKQTSRVASVQYDDYTDEIFG